MATVNFKDVNKVYDNKFHAVHDFNLNIKDKEFIVFVGPSGCGKSTTLRMVAGFEDISSGEISIDGTVVNTKAPKDRNIAMVFQNYALYPHMTVYENMAFALKLRKLAMPLYEENEEVNTIIEENKLLFKEAHEFNRKFKKNQNDLSLLEPRAEIYQKIYANLERISKLQKPIVGINQYQIAVITKTINKLNNEVNKLLSMEVSAKERAEKEAENLASLEQLLETKKQELSTATDVNKAKLEKEICKLEKTIESKENEKKEIELMVVRLQ